MLDALLNALVTDVTGLGFVLNSVAVPTVKRKGPKREAQVDQPTQITVAKGEQDERPIYHAFGKPPTTEWLLEITTLSPNNGDYLTNLPTYAQWREQIRSLFCPPSVFATNLWKTTGVWDVRPEPGKFLPREEMSNNLDDQTVFLRVKTNP